MGSSRAQRKKVLGVGPTRMVCYIITGILLIIGCALLIKGMWDTAAKRAEAAEMDEDEDEDDVGDEGGDVDARDAEAQAEHAFPLK